MKKGELSHLASEGARIAVRVNPRASRNDIRLGEDGTLLVRVTVAPEDGKATRAAAKLVARALGVAPGRLVLERGAASREKLFRLE